MNKESLTKYDDTKRPSLNWESVIDGDTCTLAFGYYAKEPTAALFKDDELITFIPREVLELALMDGWE